MNRLLLLALLALAAVHCCLADGTGGDDDVDRKRHKRPWFCHRRDCPEFKTVCFGGDFIPHHAVCQAEPTGLPRCCLFH